MDPVELQVQVAGCIKQVPNMYLENLGKRLVNTEYKHCNAEVQMTAD